MSVSALECMVEREREEKHNIENTNAEKLFHLSGMRFGFDLFGFFFFLSVGIHQNQYFPSFRLH